MRWIAGLCAGAGVPPAAAAARRTTGQGAHRHGPLQHSLRAALLPHPNQVSIASWFLQPACLQAHQVSELLEGFAELPDVPVFTQESLKKSGMLEQLGEIF